MSACEPDIGHRIILNHCLRIEKMSENKLATQGLILKPRLRNEEVQEQ